jgi:polyribonucleotide nucleotidyltransferase
MEGVLNVGDMVTVKLLDVDKQGKLKLSRKALLPRPPRPEDQKSEEAPKQ